MTIEDAYREGFADSEEQTCRYERGGYRPVGACWEESDAKAESEKTESEKTDPEKFREHLELAAEIVATWPEWKQNLLNDSPSCAARKPC